MLLPKTKVRLRPLCDDDDECYRPSFWKTIAVAVAPVFATAGLEMWLRERKRAAKDARRRALMEGYQAAKNETPEPDED